ncbi:Putative uncharacterized protein [Lactococcus lactis subsp. lactis A12]|uniref:Uncharacterized protein n=1 Tax=Lactococcus lactis subsp. lactis A12 TaxID=1137134 RepID=S6F2F6_LACLL|nr:Putative uncharacterized protein [Lactococcus lactis subsp. lactis A12]
MWMEKTIEKEI